MIERPYGQGYSVPGKDLSETVQRAARECGLKVERTTEVSSAYGAPGEPKTYDIIHMSYKNGEKNWLGLPKTLKAEVYIDTQRNYPGLTAINIKASGDYKPFHSVQNRLEEIQRERISGYKK